MAIYWFTGQPGAGKTTLAKKLEAYLEKNNKKTITIDGDDIREFFQNKDYSENGRRKNIERAQELATFLHHKGYSVLVSLVSPYRDQREEFKKNNIVKEIYVHTNEMRGRESFHVYNYEAPIENFIDIDTTNINEDESLNYLILKISSFL